MRLRKLELKDAQLTLEWMHDETVVKYMQADFPLKTIEDCNLFIHFSKNTSMNVKFVVPTIFLLAFFWSGDYFLLTT